MVTIFVIELLLRLAIEFMDHFILQIKKGRAAWRLMIWQMNERKMISREES